MCCCWAQSWHHFKLINSVSWYWIIHMCNVFPFVICILSITWYTQNTLFYFVDITWNVKQYMWDFDMLWLHSLVRNRILTNQKWHWLWIKRNIFHHLNSISSVNIKLIMVPHRLSINLLKCCQNPFVVRNILWEFNLLKIGCYLHFVSFMYLNIWNGYYCIIDGCIKFRKQ